MDETEQGNALPADSEFASEAEEDLDTARLVKRAQAGDSDAFGTIYSRYVDRVYGYLRVVLKNRDEAEDASQQVFTEALEALPRYELRPGKPFRAWLFTIVRNQALKQLRRLERVEPMENGKIDKRRQQRGEVEPEIDLLVRITDRDLLIFIQRLPLPQRQVLALYALGLSGQQIAKTLGRRPETVRMQLSRALKFLRERMTAIGRGPEGDKPMPAVAIVKQARVVRLRRFCLTDPGPTG